MRKEELTQECYKTAARLTMLWWRRPVQYAIVRLKRESNMWGLVEYDFSIVLVEHDFSKGLQGNPFGGIRMWGDARQTPKAFCIAEKKGTDHQPMKNCNCKSIQPTKQKAQRPAKGNQYIHVFVPKAYEIDAHRLPRPRRPP